MKYKAKQLINSSKDNGKWAVFTGKKYFLHTLTSNHQQAIETAISMSMQYHEEQLEACWNGLRKAVAKNDPKRVDEHDERVCLQGAELGTEHCWTSKGDLLC